MNTNIIVVTGGVYSSLGKGIIASSIGCILKNADIKVAMLKLDPYLNAFPGKLSPFQHGEVFITGDGCEADLDLGHYERFTQMPQTKYSSTTSGQIYSEILQDEIHDKYWGKTIQVVPHVTNKIIDKINLIIQKLKPEFLIMEIGGTIGDIESLPFVEALRIYNFKHKILFIHTSPLLKIEANGETKTKPTQHSMKLIRSLGINPFILILRSKTLLNELEKEKLSWTCDISEENIFVSVDCDNLYEVPQILFQQGIEKAIFKYFDIKNKKVDMSDWQYFLETIDISKKEEIKVGIYGLYSNFSDAYLSLIESLKLTAYKNKVNLKICLLKKEDISEDIKQYYVIIVYGEMELKYDASFDNLYKLCCKHNIRYFGIGLGMQIMWSDSLINSENLLLKNQIPRLGNQTIKITNNNSLAYQIFQQDNIVCRHRDHFSFNLSIVKKFNKNLQISATSEDNNLFYIEMIENKQNSFHLGILFHPEFTSKPFAVDPIFDALFKSKFKK